MRYPAPEKLEIIRLVEQSHLPVRATLDKLGITRSTFYRWYDAYQRGGPEALATAPRGPAGSGTAYLRRSASRSLLSRLEQPELSPRELAVRFTDERRYFVSEATVYRLLKAQDLITSPAYIVVKAADEFRDKTTAPNQLWQTDFTYLKVVGWGWYYLSTVLDDFSRYIVAWKLCTTMQASDVTATLDLALACRRARSGAGDASATPALRQRAELRRERPGRLARHSGHDPHPRCAMPSSNAGQDRALAPDAQEPHPARTRLLARRTGGAGCRLRRTLQPCPGP